MSLDDARVSWFAQLGTYFGWLWSVALDRPQIRCNTLGARRLDPSHPDKLKACFWVWIAES